MKVVFAKCDLILIYNDYQEARSKYKYTICERIFYIDICDHDFKLLLDLNDTLKSYQCIKCKKLIIIK